MLYYIIISRTIFLIDIFAHILVVIQDLMNALTGFPSFSVHIQIAWQNTAPFVYFWLWF